MILTPSECPVSPVVDSALELRITIVYQNVASHDEAIRTIAGLRARLGDQAQFTQTAWKSDLLEFANIRKLAILDAIEADLILISIEAMHVVSPGFAAWLAEWSEKKSNQPSALVALIPASSEPSGTPSLPDELQTLSAKCGMTLFINQRREKSFVCSDPNDGDPAVAAAF